MKFFVLIGMVTGIAASHYHFELINHMTMLGEMGCVAVTLLILGILEKLDK